MDTLNHTTPNTPTIPPANTTIPPASLTPPPVTLPSGGGDPPGGPDATPATPLAIRVEGRPWFKWLLRLVAVAYQLYYLTTQGAPAVREAIRWARSHLQAL